MQDYRFKTNAEIDAEREANRKPISKVDLHKLGCSALLEAVEESGYTDAVVGLHVSVYVDHVTTQTSPNRTYVKMAVKLYNCNKQQATRDLNDEEMLRPAGDIYEALKTYAEQLLP